MMANFQDDTSGSPGAMSESTPMTREEFAQALGRQLEPWEANLCDFACGAARVPSDATIEAAARRAYQAYKCSIGEPSEARWSAVARAVLEATH